VSSSEGAIHGLDRHVDPAVPASLIPLPPSPIGRG
jgi:hypothetical protein